MVRSLLVGFLLIAVGVAAGVVLSRRDEPAPAPVGRLRQPSRVASAPKFGQRPGERDTRLADANRRINQLEESLAAERAEHRRLQQRYDQLAAQQQPAHANAAQPQGVPNPGAPQPPAAPPVAAAPANQPPADPPPIDYSKSPMERALMTAGLDANKAAAVKRRYDEIELTEVYLRDQAAREEWVGTERFTEELAALEAQRLAVRDEIGDAAYDQYLFSLGRTNRVRIDDVMAGSPAAEVGLQAGDMILRYGDVRLFSPDELVAHSQSGNEGEMVRLVVIRNGTRFEVDVPRGPLGLRVNPTQDSPVPG
jgi:hypothetical protein